MQDSSKKQVKRGIARLKDYQQFFENPAGKNVLYDLMTYHNVMSPSFSKDPYETAFKEGQRAVVMRIFSILKAKPKDVENLIREAQDYVDHYE